MFHRRTFPLLAGIILAGLAAGIDAGESAPSAKSIKMDEPMTTGMMKPGMKKGEVKAAADKKAKALQPMMKEEQKAMPPGQAKPSPDSPPRP